MAETKTPLEHWLSLFKAPFWYEKDSCIIYDAEMQTIASLDFEQELLMATEEVVHAGGNWIAEAMNEKYIKEQSV